MRWQIIACLFPAVCAAQPPSSVGFHASGVGFRRFLSSRWSAEVRAFHSASSDERLTVLGFRSSRYFPAFSGLRPYVGGEADHLLFRRSSAEGDGAGLSVFGGAEVPLSGRFSFQLDAGPAHFWVREKGRSADAGWDLLINAGVNVHFR